MDTFKEENQVGVSAQGGDRMSSPDTGVSNVASSSTETYKTPTDTTNATPTDTTNTTPTDTTNSSTTDQLSIDKQYSDDLNASLIAMGNSQKTQWSYDTPTEINPNVKALGRLVDLIKTDPDAASKLLTESPKRAEQMAEDLGYGKGNTASFRSFVRTQAQEDSKFKNILETDTDTLMGYNLARAKTAMNVFTKFANYEIMGVTLSTLGMWAGLGLARFTPIGGFLAAASIVIKGLDILGTTLYSAYKRQNSDQYLPEVDYRELSTRMAVETMQTVGSATLLNKMQPADYSNISRGNLGLSTNTTLYNMNSRTPNEPEGTVEVLPPEPPTSPPTAPSTDEAPTPVKRGRGRPRKIDPVAMSDLAEIQSKLQETMQAKNIQIPRNIYGIAQAKIENQKEMYSQFWNSPENPYLGKSSMEKSDFWHAIQSVEEYSKNHSYNTKNLLGLVDHLDKIRPRHIEKIKNTSSSIPKHPDVEIKAQYTHPMDNTEVHAVDIEFGGKPTQIITRVDPTKAIPYSAPNKNEDYETLSAMGVGGFVSDNVSKGFQKRGTALYPSYLELENTQEHAARFFQESINNSDASTDLQFDMIPTEFTSQVGTENLFRDTTELSLSHSIVNMLTELTHPKILISALNLDKTRDRTRNKISKAGESGHIGEVSSAHIKSQLTEGLNPISFHDINLEDLVNFRNSNLNELLMFIDPLNPNQFYLDVDKGYVRTKREVLERTTEEIEQGMEEVPAHRSFISPFEQLKKEGSTGVVRDLYDNKMFRLLSDTYNSDTLFDKDLRSAVVSLLRNYERTPAKTGDDIGGTKVNFNLFKKIKTLSEYTLEQRISPANDPTHVVKQLSNQARSLLLNDKNIVSNPFLIDPVDIYIISKIPIPNKENMKNFTEDDLTKDQWDDVRDQFLMYSLYFHTTTTPVVYGDVNLKKEDGLRIEPSLRELSLMHISGSNIGFKMLRPKAAEIYDQTALLVIDQKYRKLSNLVTKANGYYENPVDKEEN